MNIQCEFEAVPNHSGYCQCKRCGFSGFSNLVDCKNFNRNCDLELIHSLRLTPHKNKNLRRYIDGKTKHYGVGTQLHKLLKQLTGEDIQDGCGCKSHISFLDRCTIEWCRKNPNVIVDWLYEEIDRRMEEARVENKTTGWRLWASSWKLPGQKIILRQIINAAINRVEGKQ